MAKPISLPVLDARTPKASRNARRRAVVLILINVLIAAHIVQWLVHGMTLSPIEPSEAMYTLEFGKVNAGFIFFVLAILSTLVFGRFFCGWGCHVVALQDLCTWMLGKAGIRPKPFRTRLLLLGPLLLALYMFVWPTFKRALLFPALDAMKIAHPAWIALPVPFPGFSNHLMVEDFWATFPPWYVAIPFLLICGFACVYFLGSKGFCSYGCPYGGFFAPADKLAVGRIVVNESCHQCGHCTAACTSNVRVHQEVRDYGMVVDPGCMKCMDCVSVCPNGALSVGFAMPAILAKPRGEAKVTPASRPPYDLTLVQDALLLVVGIAMFVGFRGLLDQVPLLMAGGLAGIGVFAIAKTWQLVAHPSVRVQNLQAKIKGRLTATGWLFALFTVAYVGVAAWGNVVKWHRWQADLIDTSIKTPFITVFSPGYVPAPEDKTRAERAIGHIVAGGSMAEGGLGWKHLPKTLVRRSWLHAVAKDLPSAERYLAQAIEEGDPSPDWVFGLARLYMLQDKPATTGRDLYERTLERHPHLHEVRLALAQLLLMTNDGMLAAEQVQRLIADTEEPPTPTQYVKATELLIQCGMQNRALEAMERAVARSPEVAIYHAGLATAQFYAKDPRLAVETMKKAVSMEPTNKGWIERLAALQVEIGDVQGAQETRRRLQGP
ncbi:MAG: 4Fe-4S dicluster domain-containing protein [Phycisphaerales bacterium]